MADTEEQQPTRRRRPSKAAPAARATKAARTTKKATAKKAVAKKAAAKRAGAKKAPVKKATVKKAAAKKAPVKKAAAKKVTKKSVAAKRAPARVAPRQTSQRVMARRPPGRVSRTAPPAVEVPEPAERSVQVMEPSDPAAADAAVVVEPIEAATQEPSAGEAEQDVEPVEPVALEEPVEPEEPVELEDSVLLEEPVEPVESASTQRVDVQAPPAAETDATARWTAPSSGEPSPPPEAPAPPPPGPPPGGQSATVPLVLAVVSLLVAPLLVPAVVAFILGRSAHKRGLPLARPAQIIAAVALVVGLIIDVVLVAGWLGGDDDNGVRYRNLVVGDCIEQPPESLRNVERIACTEPHRLEVVLVLDNPASDGTPYPGKDALVEQATERCSTALRTYASGADLTQLQEIDIVPLEDSWDDGNRRVVCTVGRTDGTPFTEPLRG